MTPLFYLFLNSDEFQITLSIFESMIHTFLSASILTHLSLWSIEVSTIIGIKQVNLVDSIDEILLIIQEFLDDSIELISIIHYIKFAALSIPIYEIFSNFLNLSHAIILA